MNLFGSPLNFVQKCKLPKSHAVGVHISSALNPKVNCYDRGYFSIRPQTSILSKSFHQVKGSSNRQISLSSIPTPKNSDRSVLRSENVHKLSVGVSSRSKSASASRKFRSLFYENELRRGRTNLHRSVGPCQRSGSSRLFNNHDERNVLLETGTANIEPSRSFHTVCLKFVHNSVRYGVNSNYHLTCSLKANSLGNFSTSNDLGNFEKDQSNNSSNRSARKMKYKLKKLTNSPDVLYQADLEKSTNRTYLRPATLDPSFSGKAIRNCLFPDECPDETLPSKANKSNPDIPSFKEDKDSREGCSMKRKSVVFNSLFVPLSKSNKVSEKISEPALLSDKDDALKKITVEDHSSPAQRRSILDMFRSIDKSTLIIQKDFYVKEKIMDKIKSNTKDSIKTNKVKTAQSRSQQMQFDKLFSVSSDSSCSTSALKYCYPAIALTNSASNPSLGQREKLLPRLAKNEVSSGGTAKQTNMLSEQVDFNSEKNVQYKKFEPFDELFPENAFLLSSKKEFPLPCTLPRPLNNLLSPPIRKDMVQTNIVMSGILSSKSKVPSSNLKSFHSEKNADNTVTSPAQVPSLVSKTVIDALTINGKTEIKITNTKNYLDDGRPSPYLIESYLQVKGKEEELRKQRELIDTVKSKLEKDDGGIRRTSGNTLAILSRMEPPKTDTCVLDSPIPNVHASSCVQPSDKQPEAGQQQALPNVSEKLFQQPAHASAYRVPPQFPQVDPVPQSQTGAPLGQPQPANHYQDVSTQAYAQPTQQSETTAPLMQPQPPSYPQYMSTQTYPQYIPDQTYPQYISAQTYPNPSQLSESQVTPPSSPHVQHSSPQTPVAPMSVAGQATESPINYSSPGPDTPSSFGPTSQAVTAPTLSTKVKEVVKVNAIAKAKAAPAAITPKSGTSSALTVVTKTPEPVNKSVASDSTKLVQASSTSTQVVPNTDKGTIALQLNVKENNNNSNAPINVGPSPDKVSSNQQQQPPIPTSGSEPTYEESLDKLRKKFVDNSFDSSAPNSLSKPLQPKKVFLRSVKVVEHRSEGKRKGKDTTEPRNFLTESEPVEINPYLERRGKQREIKKLTSNRFLEKSGKGKKKEMTSKPEMKPDPDDASKITELIDKYILENYEELSQYYLDVIHAPSPKPTPVPSPFTREIIKPIYELSVEKISSFPLVNPHKESAGFVKAKEGVLNIDLLSNPMLSSKYAALPSVSRILNDTMSKTSQKALARWKERMVQELGPEKFTIFQQEQLQHGKDMHNVIKERLMAKEPNKSKKTQGKQNEVAPATSPLNPVTEKSMASVSSVLQHISDVVAVESFVVHPHLGYKGIVDCIAKYRNKPLLIEWKLCAKAKAEIKSTYDAPLQLLAYLGALNYDKNYNVQVDGVMVVVAHLDGSPADTFLVPIDDCKKFWSLWLRRLKKYSKQFNES